jgi:peptide/nickel transport system permease protein
MIGRFLRNRVSVLGLLVFSLTLLSAILAPYLAPYDYAKMNVGPPLSGPSLAHPFGTDEFGRDLLSRVIWGSRISLVVGVSSILLASLIGVPWGLVSGFFGGRVDMFLMRAADVLLAFPTFILAIAIVAALGTSLVNLAICIGVVSVPVFARLARGMTLYIRQQEFVTAARCIGVSSAHLLFRTILPNALSPLIVQFSLAVARAIIVEASLSFLGLGAQPPHPSWGSMLQYGRRFTRSAPWYATFPGLAICLVVVSLNLVGDGLRDAADVQLTRR